MTSTAVAIRSPYRTVSEVQERLGHVPIERIITLVPPGCATEQDLLDSSITGDRGCELVDGILVEKPMGFRDDAISTRISHLLCTHLDTDNLGLVAGAQGPIRFKLDLVRMPDVSF